VLSRHVIGHPWIALDCTWREPESKLNGKWRSSLHRADRNAQRAGAVKYEFLSPTAADWEPLLNEAFRVEAAGWKGRAESALLDDDLRRLFYRRYAGRAAHKRILRLCFMRIDGEAVAMQFAVQCGRSFFLLKMGYDERFFRCSPGHLLMRETIRYAAQSGLEAFEFLGTAEPWTRMWTRRVRPCVSVRIYPNSSRGLWALAADTVEIGFRRIASAWHMY
jgi:CelD/BcsL family acetyltransferase involved in cellulose biosynthesis